MEVTSSHPLEHSGVVGGTAVGEEIRKITIPESCAKYTDPDSIREISDIEPMGFSSPNGSPNEGSEPFDTDGTEDTEDGDAIMVGVVGSVAPWFLTGWTNDVEVEFMIEDDGGQLGTCALINPNRGLTEEFRVVVGHTLVDASTPSASVLIINPNAEEVVLPCGSLIGNFVPVSAVSVARSELRLPTKTTKVLPDYLEDIVKGSHIYRSSITM